MWLLNPNNRTQLYDTLSGKYKRLKTADCLLLQLLVENEGKTLSKENIVNHVWQGRVVSESSLTQAVAQLRLTLGDSGKKQRVIKTIPRQGYMLVPGIVELDKTNIEVEPEQSKLISIIEKERSEQSGKKINKSFNLDSLFNRFLNRYKENLFHLFISLMLVASTLIYLWSFNYYKQRNIEKESWQLIQTEQTQVHIDQDPGSAILYEALAGNINKHIKHLFISQNPERFYLSCIYLSDRLKEERVLNMTFTVDLPFTEIRDSLNEACN